MTKEDIEVVPMEPSAIVAALSSGQVDGAGFWYPALATVKRAGARPRGDRPEQPTSRTDGVPDGVRRRQRRGRRANRTRPTACSPCCARPWPIERSTWTRRSSSPPSSATSTRPTVEADAANVQVLSARRARSAHRGRHRRLLAGRHESTTSSPPASSPKPSSRASSTPGTCSSRPERKRSERRSERGRDQAEERPVPHDRPAPGGHPRGLRQPARLHAGARRAGRAPAPGSTGGTRRRRSAPPRGPAC